MERTPILITCFEPFGGREVNMSREAVLALPEEAGGRLLYKLCLPVVFGAAAVQAAAEARRLGASDILCVGEAGDRKALTPEIAALNLRYARIPDNLGQSPLDEPVVPSGPGALFSTLPARKMAAAMAEAGLAAEVSYSAGAYVCNDLFYGLLHRFQGGRNAAASSTSRRRASTRRPWPPASWPPSGSSDKENHHAIPQG